MIHSVVQKGHMYGERGHNNIENGMGVKDLLQNMPTILYSTGPLHALFILIGLAYS